MSEVKRVEFGSPEEFLDFLGFLGIGINPNGEIKQKKKVLKSQSARQTSLQKKESPIKNVIFNNPATIIEWFDGTKTIVKCDKNDKYDKATGLALCICKYIMGSGEFHKEFHKWVYGVNQPETPAVATKKPVKKSTKKSTKTVKKVATTPSVESLVTTSKMESLATTPSVESLVTTSKMESLATTSKMESLATTSKMESLAKTEK